MIRVCEPWLHTRLNTVYACIHMDLALPAGHVPAMALHLKEKAQHAGYKAPRVEKVGHRLSDSSDGSDDELDLAVFRRGRPLRGQACGTDAGVLSEARPVEATRPARLACGFEATPGGGAFYGKTYSFDALSLTARSSFDSFDASKLVRCFSPPRLRTTASVLTPSLICYVNPPPRVDNLLR